MIYIFEVGVITIFLQLKTYLSILIIASHLGGFQFVAIKSNTADTCICMAESLCCPPETITILLITNTPIFIF